MKLAIRKLAMWIGAVSIAALAPLAHAGLVTDGGFVNGLADWTNLGNNVVVSDTTTPIPGIALGGTKSALFGQVSFPAPIHPLDPFSPTQFFDSLSQKLIGLDAATTYDFGFWVRCDTQSTPPLPCGDTDLFDVYLGGVLINPRDINGISVLNLDLSSSINGFDHYLGRVKPGILGSALLDFQTDAYPQSVYLDDVLFQVSACNPNCNVPEPGSLLLVGVALTAGAIVRRRRQR